MDANAVRDLVEESENQEQAEGDAYMVSFQGTQTPFDAPQTTFSGLVQPFSQPKEKLNQTTEPNLGRKSVRKPQKVMLPKIKNRSRSQMGYYSAIRRLPIVSLLPTRTNHPSPLRQPPQDPLLTGVRTVAPSIKNILPVEVKTLGLCECSPDDRPKLDNDCKAKYWIRRVLHRRFLSETPPATKDGAFKYMYKSPKHEKFVSCRHDKHSRPQYVTPIRLSGLASLKRQIGVYRPARESIISITPLLS